MKEDLKRVKAVIREKLGVSINKTQTSACGNLRKIKREREYLSLLLLHLLGGSAGNTGWLDEKGRALVL